MERRKTKYKKLREKIKRNKLTFTLLILGVLELMYGLIRRF